MSELHQGPVADAVEERLLVMIRRHANAILTVTSKEGRKHPKWREAVKVNLDEIEKLIRF